MPGKKSDDCRNICQRKSMLSIERQKNVSQKHAKTKASDRMSENVSDRMSVGGHHLKVMHVSPSLKIIPPTPRCCGTRIHYVPFRSVQVYMSKWISDLNTFYSMGDPTVFLSLQVVCRNAEALGGSVACAAGVGLYTVHKLLPFGFAAAMCGHSAVWLQLETTA